MKEVTSSWLYPGAMIPMQPVSLTTKLGPVTYLTRNLWTAGSGTAEVGVNHLSEELMDCGELKVLEPFPVCDSELRPLVRAKRIGESIVWDGESMKTRFKLLLIFLSV